VGAKQIIESWQVKWEMMSPRKRTFLENTFHVYGITLLAIVLTRFVIYDFSSLSAFMPMEKATEFEMSDLYCAVEENKAEHLLSEHVCVISIDNCSREGVLDVVNMVSAFAPAAIGLDIVFPWPEQDNSYLLTTLSETPDLVCVNKVQPTEDDATRYEVVPASFYESLISPQYGHAKLVATSTRAIVRRFYAYVLTVDGDTLLSLPSALAKTANPERYADLMKRQHEEEIIDYTSREIPVYTAEELMNGVIGVEELTDKVVLLGDMYNMHDAYLTPLHGAMAGVMIHACATETILGGTYINKTPDWINWSIGILLCILIAFLLMEARNHMSNVGSMVIRIAQIAIMYQIVVLGCKYYAGSHAYLDFSPSLLMIGLAALSFDIWFGLYGLFKYVKQKLSKK